MKTKTKKCGVYAAMAAVLLITAALITSCPPPIGELSGGPTIARVTLGGDFAARTIMPNTGTIAITAYDEFTISGKNTTTSVPLNFSGGPTYTTEALLKAATAEVTAGQSYSITVNAYINDSDTPPNPVLTTSGTGTFTAVVGSNPVDIELIPVYSTGGEGTFAWNLTYAGGASFAALTTATLHVATPTPIDVDLTATGGNTGTWPAAVPAGVYDLTLTLERTDPGISPAPDVHYVPLVITDKVHIYNGTGTGNTLVTTFTRAFAALTQVPTYTVTFNGTTAGGSGTKAVIYEHGDLITASTYGTPTVAPDPVTPALPLAEDPPTTLNGFLGWYTVSGGLGVHFPLTNKVFNTRNLYGKWNVATQASAGGDITFELPADPLSSGASLVNATISATVLNRDEVDLVAEPPLLNTYTVTVNVPAGFTLVSVKVGTQAPSGSDFIIGYARNGGDPNIDHLLVQGNTLAITVIAEDEDNVPYTYVALVTIDP